MYSDCLTYFNILPNSGVLPSGLLSGVDQGIDARPDCWQESESYWSSCYTRQKTKRKETI